MGCVSSKGSVSVTPAMYPPEKSGFGFGPARSEKEGNGSDSERVKSTRSGSASASVSFRLRNIKKYVEGEHVAAGWPSWLSAVAGEAIHGWLPLKSDGFEKLDKIGQGTYSSVFRARDLETGKIVALKKVRFDNYEPESVRFMAREILILRRLDHPNIITLEGIITSKLSTSIYLVFEYMEHDLSGLVSSSDIKFTEAQVKCYMKQLLLGVEHCHLRGIMHRDIKGSNLLVNNEGILKVADFGLANFCSTSRRRPLTSRVVTLWYRPPELLLGSTDYGPSIDLWSVGCVFAEVLLGKPLLQGRTEVEQLHKIFKLCGSPPDDYWKRSRLPHATLFKPQQHYENSFLETCKDLPRTAVDLIETLLSVEPYKRGSASSALCSEYFASKPYACDPSTLPKYQPSKEIDVKGRDDARRKRASGVAGRKKMKKPNGIHKLAPDEEFPFPSQGPNPRRVKVNGNLSLFHPDEDIRGRDPPKPSIERRERSFHSKNASQGDVPYPGPTQVSGSSGFAWAKSRRDDGYVKSHRRSSSKLSFSGLETCFMSQDCSNFDLKKNENVSHQNQAFSRGDDYFKDLKHNMRRRWSQFDHSDSFDASDEYHSQEFSLALSQKEMEMKRNNMNEEDKVDFSGPVLSQSYQVDELLEKHERHIRQAIRKSWFPRGKKAREITRK